MVVNCVFSGYGAYMLYDTYVLPPIRPLLRLFQYIKRTIHLQRRNFAFLRNFSELLDTLVKQEPVHSLLIIFTARF